MQEHHERDRTVTLTLTILEAECIRLAAESGIEGFGNPENAKIAYSAIDKIAVAIAAAAA